VDPTLESWLLPLVGKTITVIGKAPFVTGELGGGSVTVSDDLGPMVYEAGFYQGSSCAVDVGTISGLSATLGSPVCMAGADSNADIGEPGVAYAVSYTSGGKTLTLDPGASGTLAIGQANYTIYNLLCLSQPPGVADGYASASVLIVRQP
jgi:hypothetical protein